MLEALFAFLMLEVMVDGEVNLDLFAIVRPELDAIAAARAEERGPDFFRDFLVVNHGGPPAEITPDDTLELVPGDEAGNSAGVRPTVPRYEDHHADTVDYDLEDEGDLSWSGNYRADESLTA